MTETVEYAVRWLDGSEPEFGMVGASRAACTKVVSMIKNYRGEVVSRRVVVSDWEPVGGVDA